jgi:lipid A 3-O-deacylase
MMARNYFMVLICCLDTPLFPQQADSASIHTHTENYFSLNYDNDFFSGTDRYYTQGILLTFIHPVVRYSPFSHMLVRLSKDALNYYGFHAEQDVFTPRSIRYNGGAIYYGERPFTAVFFVSHSLTSIHSSKKLLLRTQLDLGVLGPEAKGEEEQKGIHKALNNIQPQGWENQLSTDYIVNYTAKIEKGFINKQHLELMASSTARLGSLYTDLGIGLNIRLGLFSPYFNNLGLEKNAALRRQDFKIYGVAKLNAKVVGYNATLEGGLTNNGNIYELPANAIDRFVANASYGIVAAYKRFSLEYTKVYITPEFKNGLNHSWGKCVVTVCF